jgi:regulator of protease activity HflC (stomatin/prohibitin superfamily)
MNKVVKAENEKIAAVNFATATETMTDGARRAEIKKADGIKQAKVLEVEGEAQAIKLVNVIGELAGVLPLPTPRTRVEVADE